MLSACSALFPVPPARLSFLVLSIWLLFYCFYNTNKMSACEIYMPEAVEWPRRMCFGLIKSYQLIKALLGHDAPAIRFNVVINAS